MFRNIITIGSTAVGVFTSVCLIIFGEAWLISAILFLGPKLSFLIFLPIFTLLSLKLFSVFLRLEKIENQKINKVMIWIKKRKKAMNPTLLRLSNKSKPLAIIISSVALGSLVTTIFIGMLGFRGSKPIWLIIGANIIFFGVWIPFYSGLLNSIIIFFS